MILVLGGGEMVGHLVVKQHTMENQTTLTAPLQIKRRQRVKEQSRHLSHREMEVISLLSDGYNTKEVSALLYVSFHTIETHRRRALQKMGARNMIHAVKMGMENGLLRTFKLSA